MTEETLFALALTKGDPAERAAFLDEACAGDADLRARVEALLESHEKAGSFLDKPAVEPAATGAYLGPESPGTRIGPYKLLQQIGEGGMGVVWMAEQQQPLRRMVALKVIKPGMDSGQVLARFEAERQALALMDHPNIARVLDAGATEAGRPYFVMELVKGVPITRYCDERRLTPRQRLELFVPVCQAIQHAHQKGVIHRDVKPSNVLVASHDGRPVPKVIDFGVAKAVGQPLTGRTLFTGFGSIVGTLEYMAPEQAEFNALDVDTRSDVYSLGVLLYELLTGTTPLTRQRLQEAALAEVLRLIREEEPPRPSTRLSTSATLPALSAQRGTEPARLAKLVRGELDWIVMKALEKDRARRYATAAGLARDVENYLADAPVEACPPSARYRLRKFVRRHRGPVLAATLVVLALVAGIIGTTWGLVWAIKAEEAWREETVRAREARDEAGRLAQQEKAAREQAESARHAIQMDLVLRAWQQHDVVRAEEILNEVGEPYRQAWETRHLRDLCRRGARSLVGNSPHGRKDKAVALSADGRVVVTAGHDETARVWEAATGRELFVLRGHERDVQCVAVSADGGRIASAAFDGTVRVWDGRTGKELLSLPASTETIRCVAITADGRRVASSGDDRKVKVWDGVTGKELLSLEGHKGPVWGVAFSGDGARLASGGQDGGVKVWDTATGKELPPLQGHKDAVFSVDYSADGTRIASASAEGWVQVWDPAAGKELLRFRRLWNSLFSVAITGDGRRVLAGGYDKLVRVWDAATGQELFTLRGHPPTVTGVATSADGRHIATAGLDRTVRVWDLAATQEVRTLAGQPRGLRTAALRGDGLRIASGHADKTVRVWDAHTGKEEAVLEGHADYLSAVAWSPDGTRIASGSADRTIKVWDAATGRRHLSLEGHTAGITSVAWSADGTRIVSGSDDRTARVWDAATGRQLFVLDGHAESVFAVAISADGATIVSAGNDQKLKIWDAATGLFRRTLRGHSSHCGVAVSADGRRVISGGFDHTVKVWDAATGEVQLTLRGHQASVFAVAASADGTRIFSTSVDGAVKVWDAATGQEKLSLQGHTDAVISVGVSAGGRVVTAGADGIKVWEAP